MQNCDNNRMDKHTLPYSAKYKTETGQQPACAQILRAILKASKYFNRRKSQVYGTFHKPSSLMYGARYKQHKLTKSSGMYYTSIYDKTVLPNPKASPNLEFDHSPHFLEIGVLHDLLFLQNKNSFQTLISHTCEQCLSIESFIIVNVW